MKKFKLILASSSKYRKDLLQQHYLPVEQVKPLVDEGLIPHEKPRARALRLGKAKGESVVQKIRSIKPWLVLASDQVCHLDGKIYQKPGSVEIACSHLTKFSGRWVTFSTSLVLVDYRDQRIEVVEDYRLQFRKLSKVDIDEYIELDNPIDCAGAIKVESFGLSLLKNAEGRDINSVYGMPLLAFFEGLRTLNYSINIFIKAS